ncbi:MAG: hypothetical protein ACK5TA_05740, partial [bacterium]
MATFDGFSGSAVVALAVTMAVFVLLAVGCLFGEEFGIRKIKVGHALLGVLLLACIVTVLCSLSPLTAGDGILGLGKDYEYTETRLCGLAVPVVVGVLVGPWLDLQHW